MTGILLLVLTYPHFQVSPWFQAPARCPEMYSSWKRGICHAWLLCLLFFPPDTSKLKLPLPSVAERSPGFYSKSLGRWVCNFRAVAEAVDVHSWNNQYLEATALYFSLPPLSCMPHVCQNLLPMGPPRRVLAVVLQELGAFSFHSDQSTASGDCHRHRWCHCSIQRLLWKGLAPWESCCPWPLALLCLHPSFFLPSSSSFPLFHLDFAR